MSSSDRAGTTRAGLLAVALCALAACGRGDGAVAAGDGAWAPADPAASPAKEGGRAVAATPAGGASAEDGATAQTTDAGATGNGLLDHPDDLQMVMLGYRLRGAVPPLAQWAEGQASVRQANEFERATVLQAERDRLQAVYDGTAGIGRLRLDVRAELSEYDGARGGYYLTAFAPGSAFDFAAQPASGAREQVGLRVDNEEELNFWPLDAAAAQAVLRRNNGSRSVVLDSRFRIAGVAQRSGGPVIQARLQRYSVVATRYGDPAVLGERSFEDAPGAAQE